MIKVHILNVGHGDCIVVEFPSGRLTVVDINRSDQMDSASLMEIAGQIEPSKAALNRILFENGLLDYRMLLEKGYDIKLTDPVPYISSLTRLSPNIDNIFRFISTHPHMDHLTGLSELNREIGITNAWVLHNTYSQDLSKLSESQKADWAFYKSLRDNTQNGITVVRPLFRETGDFWTDDDITVLAPDYSLLNTADNNDNANGMSYVLLIQYGHSKIILGGDAEEATWKYIVENFADAIKDVHLLKASHHGRDSGYYQPAVELMNPVYTAVSVGKKPDTDASNKYRQYCDHVVSTRWHGTLVFELDEFGSINFKPEYERCSNLSSMIMS